MFGLKSSATVFVPESSEGTHIAHSHRLLESATRVRIRGTVSMRPMSRTDEPVPGVSLRGSLYLKGPYAGVRFRKGRGGRPDTGSAPVEVGGHLLPSGPRVAIPEYRLISRSATAPFLWVGFMNARREPLAVSCCLGRCDSEVSWIQPTFDVPARLTAWLHARALNDRQGPVIDLSGELLIPDGVFMHVRMATDCDRRGEPEGIAQGLDIMVITPGATIDVPERKVSPGNVGGPWVSVAVRDHEHAGSLDEIAVGRCIRLDD